MRLHFSHYSYHCPKAVAKSSAAMDLVTPSHFLFRLGRSRLWPASASFTSGRRKKVSLRQVWRIRRVPQHLDIVSGDLVLDTGGRVRRRIVPMKPPQLHCQIRSLFPQMPQKCARDRDNVVDIDRLALGENVGIDKALAIRKAMSIYLV